MIQCRELPPGILTKFRNRKWTSFTCHRSSFASCWHSGPRTLLPPLPGCRLDKEDTQHGLGRVSPYVCGTSSTREHSNTFISFHSWFQAMNVQKPYTPPSMHNQCRLPSSEFLQKHSPSADRQYKSWFTYSWWMKLQKKNHFKNLQLFIICSIQDSFKSSPLTRSSTYINRQLIKVSVGLSHRKVSESF